MRWRRRPLATGVGAGIGGLIALSILGQQLFRLQARRARRLIGKPLGEVAHEGDRTYKKKYGDRIELLLLGDSIAAGLGADQPGHTLGGQLAKRLAKGTKRAVRLHTGACVGAETSMVRAQLAALPPGYRADVAVIIVGGNDVTHRVRPSASGRHLAEVIEALHAHATEVVVGTCLDLGTLTAVPQPLRAVGGRASRQLASVQREIATSLGAHAVSLA
ncbi:MAG: SGNH/GDSL hydrolase family protein, partial [Nocardioides sp.]